MSTREMTMPLWQEKHLRAATAAAGVALWSWNVDTDAITMDERAYDLWEVGKTQQHITFEILSRNIHPADLERVRSAFSATRAVVGAYEIDFRILSGSDIRWISARGQGDDADIADRVMFGIFLDVTQRKQAEEANELLAGEMSHRLKNLLTVATALTQITSRSAATKEDMAHDLTSRLIALGRAQDLVRPAPGRRNNATLLGDLISVLLAPYDEKGRQRADSRFGAEDERRRKVEYDAGAGFPRARDQLGKIRIAVGRKRYAGRLVQCEGRRARCDVDRARRPAGFGLGGGGLRKRPDPAQHGSATRRRHRIRLVG
jgi:hypothetical protein